MPDVPSPALLARLLDERAFTAAVDLLEPHLPGFSEDPSRRRSHTLVAYLGTLRAYLAWADHEWRSVLRPDPRLGTDYLAHLRAQGLSPTSVRMHHSRLTRLYARLAGLGLVAAGTQPFGLLPPDRLRPSELRDAYTPAEIDTLCARADAQGRALILLGAHGALSKDEVLGLTWRDLHFHDGRLQLLGREVLRPRHLVDALNAFAVASGQGALGAAIPPSRPLFAIPGERALRRWLWTLCRRAGVAPLASSGLRNHALLRALAERRTSEVEPHVTRSKARNSRYVQALKGEPVVEGPRRRRAGAIRPQDPDEA